MALDVARVLVTDPDELAKTDMAEHAVEALRHSNIREVVIVGRRGPAQAAYTNPELIALGQMADVDIVVDPDEVILDAASRAWVDGPDSEPPRSSRCVRSQEVRQRTATDGRKRIVLRFLASPAELIGDDRVESIRLVRNELVADDAGKLTARATNRTETLETGLVLRSIGYKGLPIQDLPFDERRGVVPNENGRVIDPETGKPAPASTSPAGSSAAPPVSSAPTSTARRPPWTCCCPISPTDCCPTR